MRKRRFYCRYKWEEGAIIEAKIYSKKGGVAKVKYKDKRISIDTKLGEHVNVSL